MIGLYFYLKATGIEGFSPFNNKCPDMLIQQGKKIYLYNSKVAKVPGINPIEFENLEDYVEFLDWQRSQGIRCPVLYLQQSYDAQGQEIYKIRPSITEPQGGLPPSQPSVLTQDVSTFGSKKSPLPVPQDPINTKKTSLEESIVPLELNHETPADPQNILLVDANHNDPPYNKNSYPSYDPSNFYQGKHTPLDQVNEKEQHLLYSANPMDANWGGPEYTQNLINQGAYKEDEVSIYIP